MKKIFYFIFLINYSITLLAQNNKLIVGIVVDQMCLDYLYRFESKFSENGFKKLMNNGTFCVNTHYNYVPTFTAPGHASIYTGTTPCNHGIVANEWYDRKSNKEVYCVSDTNVKTLGTDNLSGLFSPKNLITNTITDQLKLTYKGSKVISISLKNRSSILPGGHLSNGSYWYDTKTGNLITSTFYKKEIPKWVSDFNSKKNVDLYMQNQWNTLRSIEQYTESEDDNSPYEYLLIDKTTPTFPYNFSKIVDDKKYEWFSYTPFANTYLTDFTLEAIKNENLGVDDITDFLALSFSTPDIVGHSFGPYSVEIEDIYLRLDLEIGKIIQYLEKNIGKNNFVLFLTADHAVVPVPQYLADKQLPGGYVYIDNITNEIKNILKNEFNDENIFKTIENDNVYLDWNLIKEKKLDKDLIENKISTYLNSIKGIKKAYTTKQIEFGSSNDNWLEMIRKGYRNYESGDVIFLLEPGYLPKSKQSTTTNKGTSHGSAFNYDTHVPLIWYGNKIPNMKIYRRIEITDIVPTLAPIIKVSFPNTSTGKAIDEILNKQ